MSAQQNPVNTMERVRMESMVTHVLAKVDILGSTAKQVSYEIVFKVRNGNNIKFKSFFRKNMNLSYSFVCPSKPCQNDGTGSCQNGYTSVNCETSKLLNSFQV